jgi:predicted Zn-ribbon and HTH transcriptional regulator
MCPKCKSALVATVAYGLRANDPAFMRALARGEIVMAEGDIPMKMPAWACRACGHRWGRAR